MIQNLLIGCSTMVVCLVIQCVVVGILIRDLARLEARGLFIFALLPMLAGNLVQMAIWAGLFLICGEFQDFTTAFYHSVVNFSTLGHGDVVMSEERRLLGALEATNGVIMFGLTTSLLFAVLHALMRQAWEKRKPPGGSSTPSTTA